MIFRTIVSLLAAAMVIAFLSPVVFKLNLLPLFIVVGIGIAMMLWEQWESVRGDED